MFNAIGCY
ncbi:23S rRNA (uracil-5-)-methyltransferase RumA, partial [Yersinia pestis PY-58]